MPSSTELITAILSGLGIGGLFAVAALGLSLVFGVMRLINLAHGELIVLGAYLSYSLAQWIGLDPLLSILIVAPVVALIAYPLQRYGLTPVMKGDGTAPLLITFGVSVVLQNLFILIYTPDVRSLNASYAVANFKVGGITVSVVYIITLVAGLVLLGLTHLVVTRTGFGRRLRAASEDPAAAAVMGVSVPQMYAATFAIAAGSAAVAGVLVGLTFSFGPTAGTAYLITGFAVVVLGGIGSIKGTLVGGLLLGIIESVGAAFVGDGWRVFIGCLVVLLVLSIRPQGIFGTAGGN
ncbi:MAG TPA: branched-chain amino acid ABC transporter permease [Thermoleophilia bacterium]|nr:branched-chain amino acid ABC transporter permease [Thermoleophilia bacterium]